MHEFHPSKEHLVGSYTDHDIRRTLVKHRAYREALTSYFDILPEQTAKDFEAELQNLSESEARELADLAAREPTVHFSIQGPIDRICVKPFKGSPVLGN